MKDLYLNGLKIMLLSGFIAFGLVIVGWFLFREYIIAITMTYLLTNLIMWTIIAIFTLREKKNEN